MSNAPIEKAHRPLVDRLLFMSQITQRAGLPNVTAGLVEAAQQVAALQWELRVLKQKRTKR